jgi:hypothetical protein
MRLFVGIALASVVGALLVGCGAQSKTAVGAKADVASRAPATCPIRWKAGWQALANQVGAPVYCPAWMPQPLDGRIGGPFADTRGVGGDHSYLVSFVWVDHDVGGVTGEVHVNFRGYPGRTKIPTCPDTQTVNGKTVHPKLPCFADPRPAAPIAGIKPTLYTVNQGIDQWHLLYAWHSFGSLYTLSEHVAPPYSYQQILQNLRRMTRNLAVVEPAS